MQLAYLRNSIVMISFGQVSFSNEIVNPQGDPLGMQPVLPFRLEAKPACQPARFPGALLEGSHLPGHGERAQLHVPW